jgi:hypothetical protein
MSRAPLALKQFASNIKIAGVPTYASILRSADFLVETFFL